MQPTSCIAILSSTMAVILVGIGVVSVYKQLNRLFDTDKPFRSEIIKLGLFTAFTSLSLLYSTVYFGRNLDTGKSTFLSQEIVYNNCIEQEEIPFISQEDEEDEEDEEIAYSTKLV